MKNIYNYHGILCQWSHRSFFHALWAWITNNPEWYSDEPARTFDPKED